MFLLVFHNCNEHIILETFNQSHKTVIYIYFLRIVGENLGLNVVCIDVLELLGFKQSPFSTDRKRKVEESQAD